MPDRAAPAEPYGALYEAVGRLDARLREPLVLRYLLGYSDEETAAMLGIGLETEKGRVKRAKRKLLKILGNGD
jgi:RNA polymerase sigma-70 factor (ECF subfamily)